MSGLAHEMMNAGGAYWEGAVPYPEKLDDGRQAGDREAALRVARWSHIAFAYKGVTIERLKPGEEFPDLHADYPLLGVTIDTLLEGTPEFIQESIELSDGRVYSSMTPFVKAANTIEKEFGYFDRAALYRSGAQESDEPNKLVGRHRYYLEDSAWVSGHYVGLMSSHTQPMWPHVESERFTPAGGLSVPEAVGVNWRGNVVIPRLKVDGRYTFEDERKRGVEYLRVISAQLLWLPDDAREWLPRVPNPRYAPGAARTFPGQPPGKLPRQRGPSK